MCSKCNEIKELETRAHRTRMKTYIRITDENVNLCRSQQNLKSLKIFPNTGTDKRIHLYFT